MAIASCALLLVGCATLPPGVDAPKSQSAALAQPETATTLGRTLYKLADAHPGLSGFELMPDGTDGLAARIDLAARAERTLDVQYFLIGQDDTGKLMVAGLLDAADRGVRVRMLVDDSVEIGPVIRALSAHPNIEIRIFNPFVARQELSLFRWAEFILGGDRLNYRMHNKLFIADNAAAITGGRNVGDAYFEASEVLNLADVDLLVVGPTVRALSRSFDIYWKDRLAVPIEALGLAKPTQAELEKSRQVLDEHRQKMASTGDAHAQRPSPAGLPSRIQSLIWARAELAYDPPDKAQAGRNGELGRLLWKRVAAAAETARSELIIVTPYLVPGESEMALLRRLRDRGVRVQLVTNSLASTDMPIAHAGYVHYRIPLLDMGCELYEVRSVPGAPESHGLVKSGSGQFGLHAKVLVIDRQRVFIGSMNFDQRSMDINTEIGLIVDSAPIAREVARRVEAIAKPTNSYKLALVTQASGLRTIEWTTEQNGIRARYEFEPGADNGRRAFSSFMSLLPLERLL